MSHPLQLQLAAFRRRVKWTLVGYGLCRLLATVVAVAVALAGLDYLIRFQDPGIRAICWCMFWASIAFAFYRYVWRMLAAGFSDVELAARVAQRFPQMADRLASSIEFLKDKSDDPFAGSSALRAAVIHQTAADAGTLDWREAFDPRPLWRAAAVAAGVLVLTSAVVVADPASARIAFERLLRPFGGQAWPRINQLVLRQPIRRLAYAQPFDVQVTDARQRPLPDEVWILYRYENANAAPTFEKNVMEINDGVATAHRDQVTRPFSYRVIGGDDETMAWLPLELVDPPIAERLSVTLHFPPYTGWQSQPAEKDIRALRGTRVAIEGTASKRLRSADLCLENGTRIPAELAADGYGFKIPSSSGTELVVSESTSYWYELIDSEGLTSARDVKYEIRALPDNPPVVQIERPDANVFVTPNAELPLKIVARDDLALRDVQLRFARSDQASQPPVLVELFRGPEQLPAGPGPAAGESAPEPQPVAIDHQWQLAPLGLVAGTEVTFVAIANDYQPQATESQPRRLTVITTEELAGRLAERQSLLVNELSRVLELERDSQTQTRDTRRQVNDVGKLRSEDLDRIQAAELTHRQVDRGLNSAGEGVGAQVNSLLDDLRNNHVDSADLQRQLEQLRGELDRLGEGPLPSAERQLTQAIKAAQGQFENASAQDLEQGIELPADERKQLNDTLGEAGKEQSEVIDTLQRLVADWRQSDGYRRFQRELAQLRQSQDQLASDTAELGQQTLSKDLRDLTPQQQSDLARLAESQQELGRQFDKFQQRMQQMAEELSESDPLAAESLREAVEEARQMALGGDMQRAGQDVAKNQIGQAHAEQQQIAKSLGELSDLLANRRENELERLVEKLRDAENRLGELRERQRGLRKKLEELAKEPESEKKKQELQRLAQEEKQVEQELQRFARRLERLQAENAARSASRAGQKIGQAGEQGQQQDAQGAGESAEQAEKDLDEAQQQLAERRQQAEQDLAAEQMSKLEDALHAIEGRQQSLLDETVRLNQIFEQQKRLTRGQALSLTALSKEQDGLGDETLGLGDKLKGAEGFLLALGGAQREMHRAAQWLDERRTDNGTQQAERNALRRLQLLREALLPEKGEQNDQPEAKQPEDDQGGGGAGAGGDEGDVDLTLAQLKLIKLLQVEINLRTAELEKQYGGKQGLNDAQQQEFQELSEEQGRLADVIRNLVKAEAASDRPAGPDWLDKPEGGNEPPNAPANDPPGEESPRKPAAGEAPARGEGDQPLRELPPEIDLNGDL